MARGSWWVRQYRGFRIWLAREFGLTMNAAWFGVSPLRPDNTEPLQRAINSAGGWCPAVYVGAGTYWAHAVITSTPLVGESAEPLR